MLSGTQTTAGVRADAVVVVLHVDEDEVVAGEVGDLDDGRGEGEEGHAVDDLIILDLGLEGHCSVPGGVLVSGCGGVGGQWCRRLVGGHDVGKSGEP